MASDIDEETAAGFGAEWGAYGQTGRLLADRARHDLAREHITR